MPHEMQLFNGWRELIHTPAKRTEEVPAPCSGTRDHSPLPRPSYRAESIAEESRCVRVMAKLVRVYGSTSAIAPSELLAQRTFHAGRQTSAAQSSSGPP